MEPDDLEDDSLANLTFTSELTGGGYSITNKSLRSANWTKRNAFTVYEVQLEGLTFETLETFDKYFAAHLRTEEYIQSELFDIICEQHSSILFSDNTEGLLRIRRNICSIFQHFTIYAFENSRRFPWMTRLSFVKCMNQIQRLLWNQVVIPALRDKIYVENGVEFRWVFQKMQLLVDHTLPYYAQRQMQGDLEVFRKYLIAGAEMLDGVHNYDLLSLVEIIAKSKLPWCIFPGQSWFTKHGLEKDKARKVMQLLSRRGWIEKVTSSGNSNYYTLALDRLKIPRSQAKLGRNNPTWAHFRSSWKSFRFASWNPRDFQYVNKQHLEPEFKSIRWDWPTLDAINQIESTFGYFDVAKRAILNHALNHLIYDSKCEWDKDYGSLSKERQCLSILRCPMLERRILMQVIIPLVTGLRSIDYEEEFVGWLLEEIDQFAFATIPGINRYLEKIPEENIEYAADSSDAYMPCSELIGVERSIRNRRQYYYDDPKKALSKSFAESVILDFAMSKGKRTFFEKYSTLMGFADWNKKICDRFPDKEMYRELVLIYRNLFKAKNQAQLIALFASGAANVPGVQIGHRSPVAASGSQLFEKYRSRF